MADEIQAHQRADVTRKDSTRSAASYNYREFCDARRCMLGAFRSWMNDRPDGDDVQQEIDATVAALRQLNSLR